MPATVAAPPSFSMMRSAGVLMAAPDAVSATDCQQNLAIFTQQSQCDIRNNSRMEEVVDQIKEALERGKPRGKSQRGLARAMGLDPSAVSRIFKGERRLHLNEIEKAKAYLGPFDDENLPQPYIVREINARASAGGGSIVHHEDALATWGFPEAWVRSVLRATPKDLDVLTVDGDSMVSSPPRADDINPGDRVVINKADRSPSPAGYFLLWDGMGLVAKRIEFIVRSEPPRIRIISNNEKYSPYEVTLEEANIIGRIVGKWQRL
jgi:phage repressor protein C with HTH and peptisase S24 domain